MKKFILAICLLQTAFSFGQIQFDSCFVYKDVDKSDVKENQLLWEFWQLSGSTNGTEKLSTADLQTFNTAINRATNMTFAIPKLPANGVFIKAHSKGVMYGFVLLASKRLMIDVAKSVKLVFENPADLEFINKLDASYSFKKSQLHGK